MEFFNLTLFLFNPKQNYLGTLKKKINPSQKCGKILDTYNNKNCKFCTLTPSIAKETPNYLWSHIM